MGFKYANTHAKAGEALLRMLEDGRSGIRRNGTLVRPGGPGAIRDAGSPRWPSEYYNRALVTGPG